MMAPCEPTSFITNYAWLNISLSSSSQVGNESLNRCQKANTIAL